MMKTSYCTVTVPVRKRSNIVYLEDWKAAHLQGEGRSVPLSGTGAPGARLPALRFREGGCFVSRPRARRSRRADFAAALELLATAAAVGVMAALILRLLLF